MMKKTLTILVILTSSLSLWGQSDKIGQSAETIKNYVINHVNTYNRASGINNSSITYDVKYSDGEIKDVIICFENEPILDMKFSANFCRHYIMENGKLAYTLTQFENISTAKIQSYYENDSKYYKSGNLFYSKDYTDSYEIYLAKNGYATIERRKVSSTQLPLELKQKQFTQQNEEKEIKAKKEEEEQEKKEIVSKVYNLEIYDTSAYNLFTIKLTNSLIQILKRNSFFPDFKKLEAEKVQTFAFKSSYSAYYKLEINNYNSYYRNSEEKSIKQTTDFNSLSDFDINCSILKSSRVRLPTIIYKGYTVMTEAKIPIINIEYEKGITIIKIKKGKISYKKNQPSLNIQASLNEKIKNKEDGVYRIKYHSGKVMNEPFIFINVFNTRKTYDPLDEDFQ